MDGYQFSIPNANGTVIIPIPSGSTHTTIPSGVMATPIVLPGQITWVGSTGWNAAWIPIDPNSSVEPKKEKLVGCFCKKCKDFNEFAESNQEDGSFICYTCRKGA